MQHLGQVLAERVIRVADHSKEVARLAGLVDLVDAMLPIDLQVADRVAISSSNLTEEGQGSISKIQGIEEESVAAIEDV